MDNIYERFNEDDLDEYFFYLEELRKSGITNMAGARPYLADEYDLDKEDSMEVLLYWMNHYDELAKKLNF